jgi:hypothetical protein
MSGSFNPVAERAAALADRKAAARARRSLQRAGLADLAREALRRPFLEVCAPEQRRRLARECLAAAGALALAELGAAEAGAALQAQARKCFDGPERGRRPGLEAQSVAAAWPPSAVTSPATASLLPSREKGRRIEISTETRCCR